MSAGRFKSLEFEGDKTAPIVREASAKPRAASASGQGAELRDAAYYLREAEKEELAGNSEAALRQYAAALAENPLCLEAWLGQVLMLLDLAEYDEASLWADKAMEKFPDHPQLLSAKAAALFRMGRKREAQDFSDAALAKKGESEILWLFRGEIMLADSRPAAEECFGHALRLAANKPLARLRQAKIALAYEHLSLALGCLQDATLGLPKSALAWYLLGKTQEALAMYKQAQRSYQQAAALAPQNPRYRAALSRQPSLAARLLAWLRRVFSR